MRGGVCETSALARFGQVNCVVALGEAASRSSLRFLADMTPPWAVRNSNLALVEWAKRDRQQALQFLSRDNQIREHNLSHLA